MYFFTPKRCSATKKIMYANQGFAQQEANRLSMERGTQLSVYRCDYCNTWHLTSHSSGTSWSYTHVPLNQQLKPHSRKKGYKPRRK